MNTLIKTLDFSVNDDRFKSVDELRSYVPYGLTIMQTGFSLKSLVAQTLKIIGGYFTNANNDNLGDSLSIPATAASSASAWSLVVPKATCKDCYVIIPNRFQIHSLNLRGGINYAYCELPMFEDALDIIAMPLINIAFGNKDNGQIDAKYFNSNISVIVSDMFGCIVGNIGEFAQPYSQITLSGEKIYGNIAESNIVKGTNYINIKDAPNISGTVEGVAAKLTQETVNYARICNIISNGNITYNGEAVPFNKTVNIAIPANSTNYTVTIQ